MASETIGVIGLGYVGLPVAAALAAAGHRVVGFDIDEGRIDELRRGEDRTREVEPEALANERLSVSATVEALRPCTVYIVTVPTPVDDEKRPDFRPLQSASRTVGSVLAKGDLVVYESTVYPGATEEVCLPVLLESSGLSPEDIQLGYSPERINPGDKEHTVERITKVVSASTPEARERAAAIYGSFVSAGVHVAPDIATAEAAKVLENTQRDLNIALMNELAIICDRLGIHTNDVLAAAGTKWNFLRFSPGLVGGHCIGVDPYYLTAKAEKAGYHPEVILAGRRINDTMASFVAQKLLRLLVQHGDSPRSSRVGVFGLSFKENVPDLRNSQVPKLVDELLAFGINAAVHDPMVDPAEARHEYGMELVDSNGLTELDALVLAVAHRAFLDDAEALLDRIKPGGILVDVKGVLREAASRRELVYWSL